MSDVLLRSWPAELAVRSDGDGRVLHGPLLPWRTEAKVLERGRVVLESFERGALAGVDPGRVALTIRHPTDNQELPVGVTVELRDEADALHGAWRVSKTAAGDELLELARDRVPLGLSIGFVEIPGGSRWSPDRRHVVRVRADLDHVAVVRRGAYVGAEVAGVRSEDEGRGLPLLTRVALMMRR
jgi:HK97 family phage prohead protease